MRFATTLDRPHLLHTHPATFVGIDLAGIPLIIVADIRE